MSLCLPKHVEAELRAIEGNNVSPKIDAILLYPDLIRFVRSINYRFVAIAMQKVLSGLPYHLEYLCVLNAVGDIEH